MTINSVKFSMEGPGSVKTLE